MDTEEAWEYLTEYVGVSESALKLVTAVAGYNISTLEAVLYHETGYNDFEQAKEDDE